MAPREWHQLMALPEWACARARGQYMVRGASLPTRDGRKNGNAVVTHLGYARGLHPQDAPHLVASVTTDAGNEMTLNLEELFELFWPPMYVMSEDALETFLNRRKPQMMGLYVMDGIMRGLDGHDYRIEGHKIVGRVGGC